MSVTVGPTTRSLLRGLVALRWATWGWSVAVVLASTDRLARPWLAVLLLAAALGVNLATTAGVRAGREMVFRRLIVADLTVAFGMLALEGFAFEEGHAFAGRQGLAGGWPVAGILTAGVTSGPYVGAAAGAGVGTARLLGALANGVRDFDGDQVTSLVATIVFYALYGAVAGWVGRLLARAERDLAVTKAREEVARTLHDGVLQALALVVRRTASSDPELARVARDSDRDLRAFLAGAAAGPAAGGDLLPAVREVARRAARPFDLDVTVAAVDDDITLDASTVTAVAGAVGEAITNVGKHAGVGRAVVFAERQDDGTVFVSVRDEGCGFTADGGGDSRGVRGSIVGRVSDAGGRAEVVSEPGHGTEVRLWVR